MYANAPTAAYISTLVEGSIPRAERIGSIYVPDANWTDAEVWTPATLLDRALNAPLSDLSLVINEIQSDPDEEEPPTAYAANQAILLCSASTSLLGHRWIMPRVASDGYGGLRLSWRNGQKELRAVIAGNRDQERYLYWEDETGYGSVGNFTEITLFTYLDKSIVRHEANS
jgi:hypothetical protein